MHQLLLFILAFNDFFYPIPESVLDNTELSDTGYGFQVGDVTYLSFLARIVSFNREGQILAVFDQKGSGPGELKTGGPIFTLENKFFCHDVMGFKFVRMSMDLKVEKEEWVKDYALGNLTFFNNSKTLWSLSRVEETSELLLETWNLESLKASKVGKPLPFSSRMAGSPIVACFLSQEEFLFTESAQGDEDMFLFKHNLTSGNTTSFTIPNPDYDTRAKSSTRSHYFEALKYAISIKTISQDATTIYLFIENFRPGRFVSIEIEDYRYIALERESLKPLCSKVIPYVSISGLHPNSKQVMENQDGDVVIAEASYFLNR